MNKKIKKVMTLSLLGATICGIFVPLVNNSVVYASEQVSIRELSTEEIRLIDEYVEIKNKRYVLKEDAPLSNELKQLANQYINKTNKAIEEYIGDLRVDKRNKSINGFQKSKFRAPGKNDIKFFWNYARIYIDANNLRLALQVGFMASGVYAPAKVIRLVCGFLGIASGEIRDGIWFDWNYFYGVLGGSWGIQ